MTGHDSRPVVSADDVRAARRTGAVQVEVPPGAIVTPLAREEASRWGIDLVPPAEIATTPDEPGSDPSSDVDRIVERVRGLVPDADPEVVRQIARNVLRRWSE